MEKQTEDDSKGKLDAGRGIVQDKSLPSDSDDKNKEKDRPDERARKAGF